MILIVVKVRIKLTSRCTRIRRKFLVNVHQWFLLIERVWQDEKKRIFSWRRLMKTQWTNWSIESIKTFRFLKDSWEFVTSTIDQDESSHVGVGHRTAVNLVLSSGFFSLSLSCRKKKFVQASMNKKNIQCLPTFLFFLSSWFFSSSVFSLHLPLFLSFLSMYK